MPAKAVRLKGSRKGRKAKQRRVEKQRGRIMAPHCFIPSDITREILLRLPVSTLLRFRPVCKLWLFIIRDPHFIQSHLERTRYTLPCIIFDPEYETDSVVHITRLDADKCLSSSVTTPYFSKKPNGMFGLTVTGSCNGLLCIVGERDGTGIKVLNPLTGESLTPPPQSPSLSQPLMVFLGYHPVTKEYKLVHFTNTCLRIVASPRTSDLQLGCEVYTLGTGLWREIARFGFFFLDSNVLVSAKGFMYWRVNDQEEIILCFDLSDESFTMISAHNLDQSYRGGYELGNCLVELHGSICLSVISMNIDLWTLNDDEHSWTQRYSIRNYSSWDFRNPLLIHEDKLLVYVFDKSWVWQDQYTACLVQYHPLMKYGEGQVKDCRRSHEWLNVFDNDDFIPLVHVESLVSLTKFQNQRAETMVPPSLVVSPTIQTYRWSESPS